MVLKPKKGFSPFSSTEPASYNHRNETEEIENAEKKAELGSLTKGDQPGNKGHKLATQLSAIDC
jgi:hypothetical protein